MEKNDFKYNLVHEKLNTISHGLAFVAAVFGSIWLINTSLQEYETITFVSIVFYCLSLCLVFLTSANYHAESNTRKKQRKRIYDHIAIFYLITGTYAPFVFIQLNSNAAYLIFGILLFLSIVGTVFKLVALEKTKWIALAAYIFMGVSCLFIFEEMSQKLNAKQINLLIFGGCFYLVGVVFYVWKKIKYNHFIWHLFVMIAASCHFLAIKNIFN